MAAHVMERIRNLGIFGHGDAGKTTLTEAMLFSMGETTRLGTVDDGTTLSDYTKAEIERKISIQASVLRGHWKDHPITLLDTPGSFDFVGEVVSSLRVVDLALFSINASSGADVGTDRIWSMVKKQELPRLFFVSKLNREHVNWNRILADVQERFGDRASPVQFPIETGEGFESVADVLLMKKLKFARDGSGKFETQELEGDAKARAQELRAKLVELAAEADDELIEAFFDKGDLTSEQFDKGLRMGIRSGRIFPILCGAANTNMGVSRLLDFLVQYGPAPMHRPPVSGDSPMDGKALTRAPSEDGPVAALVFKTISEAHLGELSFFRVFSGTVTSGMELRNPNTNSTEKIGQIFWMSGRNRTQADKLIAGEIGATVKLRNTRTGDTLCDARDPFRFPPIEFPDPVLETGIVPKAKGDEEKISGGFHSLLAEDPSFTLRMDAALGQIVLAGQGDLHITVLVDKLKERSGVEVDLVEPKIPYRETIRGKAEAEGKHKKQTGGRGQFGVVNVKLEPKARGEGYEFVNEIFGGAIPSKYVPAVDKGIQDALTKGVVAGYPVVDCKVTLYDGKFHEVDSSELAFKIAGSLGFRSAFKKSQPVILEPIYDLEVRVPEEYMGDIMGDLSSRRGKIQGMESEGHMQVIRAKVPLKELYRYATALRSMTQGRGFPRQSFSHYEEVPPDIQQKLIAAHTEEKEEE
ncbi:MAG: elongation factor G [bacterium]